ncbi:MAG: hypothetical protein PHY12_07475 [Eubacteriales bacterium]|nr:hypothetical protein [Eubacteriales bacterium]
MAQELYGFFNSTNDDARSYEADDMATALRAVCGSGVSNLADCLRVSAEGGTLRTKIAPGRALVQGYFYELRDDGGAQTAFTHAAASGNDRIDRVVVRLDYTARTVSLVKKEGVPGAAPTPPALARSAAAWELALASVRVRAGATAIAAGDVTDERADESLCGAALPEAVKLSGLWDKLQKPAATATTPGLMSAADKQHLDALSQAVTPSSTAVNLGGRRLENAVLPYGSTTVPAKLDALGALTGQLDEQKLDSANVYNGLDKEAAGFALDARQGKELKSRFTLTPLATGLNWSSGSITVPGWKDWLIVCIWMGDTIPMCYVDGTGVARPSETCINSVYQYTTAAVIVSNGDTLSFDAGFEPKKMLHAVGGAHRLLEETPAIKSIYGVLKR